MLAVPGQVGAVVVDDDFPVPIGSCGVPRTGMEVAILDPQGNRLAPGETGEICVRGPGVFAGYYNNPEAGAAFTADGWFRTGDMASIDRYGYVQLSDRKKDLIKRKGEWISSVDMENYVLGHPGVLEAAVVARPDAVCDEVPAVLVVRRDDPAHPVEPQDIIDLLARKFAKWQLPLPEDIHFIESFGVIIFSITTSVTISYRSV